MAEKALYYPWFPRDFSADEAVLPMTLSEEGAYRRLLDHQWLHGSIPVDLGALCGICKNVTPREMKKIWTRVSVCFVPVPDDPTRLYNRRLERQREEVEQRSAKMSRKGKLGAEKRWGSHSPGNGTGNSTGIVQPITEASPRHARAISLAMPGDSNTNTNTPTPARAREVGEALQEKLAEPHNIAIVQQFITAIPSDQKAAAFQAKLLTWLSGHDWPPGPKLTPNAAASALAEYLDNPGDFSPAHVSAFLLRTVRLWHRHSEQLVKGAGDVPVTAQQDAVKLWGELKRSGVLYASTTEEWQTQVSGIVENGAATSADDFTQIWREFDLPFLRAASTERAAVAHIAEAVSRVRAAA